MKGRIVLLLTMAFAARAAETPWRPYVRDGQLSLTPTGDVTRVAHVGDASWEVVRRDGQIAVRPGEAFRLVCSLGNIRKTDKAGVLLAATLFSTNGQALSWRYGCVRAQPNGTTESTFVVPEGGAALMPRIFGQHDADFDLKDLSLERTATVPRAADLPDVAALRTDALDIEIQTATLALAVTDRRTGRIWRTTAGTRAYPRFLIRKFTASARALRFGVTDAETGTPLALIFATDPTASTEFTVTLAGRGLLKDRLPFPDPFVGAPGDHMILPLSEGFRLPMHERTFVGADEFPMWSSASSMAFFGVEEDATGAGWMTIAETRNDALIKVTATNGVSVALGPAWASERGQFGAPRVVRYAFLDRGGYVAMAKRYRRAAEASGLVKTFREKAKERPVVDRLLGAANVWYFPAKGDPTHAAMARELKAAGLDRFLWSSDAPPNDVVQIASLPDVLIGRYDCYRDIYPPKLVRQLGWPPKGDDICRNTAAWPDGAIWNSADANDLRRAWGVTCPDGQKRFCVAQCTRCQPARVREHVARELKAKPFSARFIDVTTAVGAEECANPAHPATRTQSRQAIGEILGLLGQEFGLVVGSEQGVDFAVPFCDYFEGMLSPTPCRMPHGRPGCGRTNIFREGTDPKGLTAEEFARVTDFGLNARYRIPLFELVYHDCCCAHWYWYDYSNRPISLWRTRDLFNVLYGTAPMYIFDHRLWTERKERFIESYRMTSPIARHTGYSEMTDHRALTPDRLVQRTAFADGTVVTVNFGTTSYRQPNGTVLPPLSADQRFFCDF